MAKMDEVICRATYNSSCFSNDYFWSIIKLFMFQALCAANSTTTKMNGVFVARPVDLEFDHRQDAVMVLVTRTWNCATVNHVKVKWELA